MCLFFRNQKTKINESKLITLPNEDIIRSINYQNGEDVKWKNQNIKSITKKFTSIQILHKKKINFILNFSTTQKLIKLIITHNFLNDSLQAGSTLNLIFQQ